MKSINLKKMFVIMTTSFILLSSSGCKMKEETNEITDNTNYQSHSVIETQIPVNDENSMEKVPTEETVDESEIVTYFNELETELDTYNNESNLKQFENKIKDIAITGIDFIFYGTEINGITFDQLTDSTKEKIMAIVARIDTKIEEKIPNYKETITNKFGFEYNYVTSKLKQGINSIDDSLENKYGDKYNDVKEKASEIKDEVGEDLDDVYQIIKDKSSQGFSKIKDWYEKKTDKR